MNGNIVKEAQCFINIISLSRFNPIKDIRDNCQTVVFSLDHNKQQFNLYWSIAPNKDLMTNLVKIRQKRNPYKGLTLGVNPVTLKNE